MHAPWNTSLLSVVFWAIACAAFAEPYDPPDRGQPGDEMIQNYLARETEAIESRFADDVRSADAWQQARPRYQEEYFYMLGLDPMPPKTPLEPKVTGTLEGDGYVVEKLCYQSRPHLYVTGNLYRPPQIKRGERLPAVFYVCGHSGRGRNGNKTAYQSHGMWFARHGYVCLVVDSLQLGEIGAIHHGTYRENRWWWHSRGYTPAGVEGLNGMRGIDYLASRTDVDPERIGVTGISGGGAATYWISAADPRVKVAVPVSGMADLTSYVTNRVINGHCDCMFLYNTFQWPWTRIAALIAPRPMLFTNSDHDAIFPMDANLRVIDRLKQVYRLDGAEDRVDSFVSSGGHAYREDIRKAAFRFINTHLKGDSREVTDSEVDLVVDNKHPIDPEKLRVFPEDADIPADELNTTIDRHFVPVAEVAPPGAGQFDPWKAKLVAELRRVVFRCFPERIGPATELEKLSPDELRLQTEPAIEVRLRRAKELAPEGEPRRIVLVVRSPEAGEDVTAWMRKLHEPGDATYLLLPRGVGPTQWTRKNPPNYVERSHVLLGRTVDTGRVWDVVAAARFLAGQHQGKVPVCVAGEGPAALLAAYAAVWEPDITGVILRDPPPGHMDPAAPQFLNILRVCDAPDMLGLVAPRPLTVYGGSEECLAKTAAIYSSAGAGDKFACKGER